MLYFLNFLIKKIRMIIIIILNYVYLKSNTNINNDTINNDTVERPSKRRRIERSIESDEDKSKSNNNKKNKKNKKNTDKSNKIKINIPIEETLETHDILKCIDIRDIKFPLTITQDLISKLLKKNVDKSDFPYYMYT